MENRIDFSQRECFDNAVNKKLQEAALKLTKEEIDSVVDNYRIRLLKKYKGLLN